MENESPNAKVSRRSMVVLVLGSLLLNVLISAYVQVATSRWNVALLTFVGLLLLDAIILVPFFRKNQPKPEQYGGTDQVL
jgi:membrane protein implicated in regulation of membrane protease activity